MKPRGWLCGRRRVRRRDECCAARRSPAIAAALSLVLLAAAAAAAFAIGCGGFTRTAGAAPFVGRWERVEAGAPNPDFTLSIEPSGDGATVTFANHTGGMSATGDGTVHDGFIACTVPTADAGTYATPGVSPAPIADPTAPSGVPTLSKMQLSLDENGQLVVDLVLGDGTLEPIWIYQRVDGASPSAPATL